MWCAATAAHKAQTAKSGIVVHNGIAGNDGSIVNMDMATQQHTVHQDDTIMYVAVVCHMAVGHEHVAVADPCDAILFLRTFVDCHAFAKDVVISDDDLCRCVLETDILGLTANNSAWKETVVLSDRGTAGQHNMALQFSVVTDGHIWADQTKRTDVDSGSDGGRFVNVGHAGNVSVHAIVPLIKAEALRQQPASVCLPDFRRQRWPPVDDSVCARCGSP